MNAFDRFWQWANKSLDSPLAIPAELHARQRRTTAIAARSMKPCAMGS
jgi:hypothetical protein